MYPRCRSKRRPGFGLLLLALGTSIAAAGVLPGAASFHKDIEPVLTQYCYDCHADGMNKGGVAFDEFQSDQALLTNRDLWWNALKYVRAGIMPPEKKPHPTDAEKQLVAAWIKSEVFGIDSNNPDPGRVTVRRLNRVEYRNTVRDLLGVDYDTNVEFPPDDTGYGFDDIGDVLTLSPMLLEKYVTAASDIIARWAGSKNCARFFPSAVPAEPTARRQYARALLRNFACKAFRRPVDERTVNRLAVLAEGVYTQPGKTFEGGITYAMEAVIASPRFLFRIEENEPGSSKTAWSQVNEYSLASRLSYFLWSTMPDEKLTQLAARGELRKNLSSEVKRLMADPRSQALIENFTGQWLQVRDLSSITIHSRSVLARDEGREKELQENLNDEANGLKPRHHLKPRFQLDSETRTAMKNETEMFFDSIVREDRPVTDFIESDYTFLNEELANLYGLTNLNVSGSQMRRVQLPADSPRGGVLAQGSVLTVTSNPDRTSPVKRGLFVLNNILGTPSPPPPPNIPALEASEHHSHNQPPTLRATLERHRSQPMCASCHDRLDPIGLAMENFNALGMWREQERGQCIDPAGKLVTGESFKDVRELKHVLATKHRTDFFRCLTEKMLTYAIGRGLEYYDVETVDKIVRQLEQNDGRFSVLLNGIIESAPFQKQRNQANPVFAESTEPTVKAGNTTR